MEIVLSAYANPYAEGMAWLDHNGLANTFVPKLNAPEQRIGAMYDAEASLKEKRPIYKPSNAVETIHCASPIDFAYYKRFFEEGALVPADEQTAKRVGVAFKAPNEVIQTARTRAIKEWRERHGFEPACAASAPNDSGAQSVAKP